MTPPPSSPADPSVAALSGGCWAGLLGDVSAGRLRQRNDQVRQLVRDHGVTYNVPGDRQGEHAWRLDALPILVTPAEFESLRRGMVERAHLLARVLADLYGPQQLLRQGHLPARLVLANPTFLRPCHQPPSTDQLILYAADVVRTKVGGWCLLRDRTQAPTGAGYALENRLVVSQVLAEPFRQHNTLRLASFFRALRETLAALTPNSRDQPRIVLQSSGAASPTYFEQALLAQYLGYPLVEGGDLTVRERRIFLKTLGGLSPVDVIFRQIEDDYCDPLELRPDSQLGCPGLVEAIRAGHVVVCNGLGTGLAQSPAFLPFLPSIARDFFGETLSLDQSPSLWCGAPGALTQVLAKLDGLAFRAVWPTAAPSLTVPAELSGKEREIFLAKLQQNPELYVAQELVDSDDQPVLDEPATAGRPWVLRGYAIRAGDSYDVMSGGLALAAGAAPGRNIAIARGALAKDVWVGSHEPVRHFSLLPPASHSVELSRGGADLPSRSADNLFWLGRYAERAECTARLARYLVGRLADEGNARTPSLPTLLAVLSESTELPVPTAWQEPPLGWLARALCSPAASGSLRNALRAGLRAAAAVRDRLSSDTFRVLGTLGDEADRAEELLHSPGSSDLAAFLDRIVTGLSALSGLSMESMTRGHGWRFLDMGRRLERALQLLSLLRAAFAVATESESTLLEALLAVADSSITYRRRYLAGLHPAAVVDLLLVDAGNPRAVLFQIAALRDHLVQLPHEEAQARLRPEERLALGCLTRLQLLDVIPACVPDQAGHPPPILAVLAEITGGLSALSEELCGSYLSHAVMPRALAGSPRPRGGA
jgi:uncharacterized circularly permuted ATP-grasp superfamily protein/uncharacterized alpha-E superfamily protein